MPAKIIEVIQTDFELRGSGKSAADPIRRVTQYWTRDGELLAEVDPAPDTDRHLRELVAEVRNEHTGTGTINPAHCTICTKAAQLVESGVVPYDE